MVRLGNRFRRQIEYCALAFFLFSVNLPAANQAGDNRSPAAVTIDYPADGTLFPPDFAPPTFLWRDADPAATVWRIQVSFGERAAAIDVKSNGERLQIGEIDE